MKILDGYGDYLNRKELTCLLVKIASLPKYKSFILDSDKAFKGLWNASYLARSSFIYIFLNKPRYIECILDAFNTLSDKQKLNFYSYYCDEDIRNSAIRYGFFSKYNMILQKLQTVAPKPLFSVYKIIIIFGYIFAFAFYLGLFLLLESKLHSPLLTLMLVWILASIGQCNAQNTDVSTSIEQNDLIIQKLNYEVIEESKKWAEEELMEANWLNKEKRIKED